MAAILFRARYVAPIDGPLIENGAILVEGGRIAAVGKFDDFSAADCRDLGECVVLPGLINAHTHLELSHCKPGEKPAGGFEQWLTRMLSQASIDPVELKQKSARAALHGGHESLRFGVTGLGDISRQCDTTRAILRTLPLRVTSFGEVTAMGQHRALLQERVVLASDRSLSSERLRIGISPHSPYSIEPEGFRHCLEVARRGMMPIATHLAETPSEWEFLASHTGPLKELWDAWMGWDDEVPFYAGGPIRLAQELGLLEYGAVLAHVNYCSDAEMQIIRSGRSSVVYCPRTHEFFGHPPHRFREMLRMGINVAIGSDSCASSPDLNLVDDLRLVHSRYPEIDAHDLWRMVSVNGAKALWCAQEQGSLARGKHADFVAFPVTGGDPLREILENAILPRGVWIGGKRVAQLGNMGTDCAPGDL